MHLHNTTTNTTATAKLQQCTTNTNNCNKMLWYLWRKAASLQPPGRILSGIQLSLNNVGHRQLSINKQT